MGKRVSGKTTRLDDATEAFFPPLHHQAEWRNTDGGSRLSLSLSLSLFPLFMLLFLRQSEMCAAQEFSYADPSTQRQESARMLLRVVLLITGNLR